MSDIGTEEPKVFQGSKPALTDRLTGIKTIEPQPAPFSEKRFSPGATLPVGLDNEVTGPNSLLKEKLSEEKKFLPQIPRKLLS